MDVTTALHAATTKLEQLQPSARAPAIAWANDCFSLGYPLFIVEVDRAQQTQDRYFLQGRPTEQAIIDDFKKGLYDKSTMLRGIQLLKRMGPVTGQKVTWTLDSMHTRGFAADVYPIGFPNIKQSKLLEFYEHLDDVGEKYGIYRPKTTVKQGDLGHYQFEQSRLPPPPKPLALKYQILGLEKQLKLAKTPSAIKSLTGKIKRLKDRL